MWCGAPSYYRIVFRRSSLAVQYEKLMGREEVEMAVALTTVGLGVMAMAVRLTGDSESEMAQR